MATSPAKPFVINKAGVYKPSIGYQKNIDINYNDGFKLKDSDIYISYRYSLPAVDGDSINSITIGNYSNTKNIGSNRNLYSPQTVIIDSPGVLLQQSMVAGYFNFTTGKLQDNDTI